MVQQGLPFLILRRVAEPLGMVLERLPANEQSVATRRLDAPLQLQRVESRHRRNDALRLGESALEGCRLAGNHVQDRDLQDHCRLMLRWTSVIGVVQRVASHSEAANSIAGRRTVRSARRARLRREAPPPKGNSSARRVRIRHPSGGAGSCSLRQTGCPETEPWSPYASADPGSRGTPRDPATVRATTKNRRRRRRKCPSPREGHTRPPLET